MSDMTFTEATFSRAVSAPSVERSELPHIARETVFWSREVWEKAAP
jgi:hypothetical protein